jgi:hypothetical protein
VRDTIDPMEWDGVRGLRTWIGQGMRDPILRNIGETNLNRLYASLSSDMKATAETHGLLDEFNAANTVSQELRTVAEEHIGKIAQAVTPEAAYKAAVQGSAAGGTRLSILRQHLPTTTDELGAVHLHHALEDPKVWNGLSPEAKAQLVPDGGAREAVERAMKLPPVGDGGGAVRSILGGEVGGNIGQAFLDTTLGKAAGSVIGAIAPHALVGMKLLGRNPASLRLPAIGAASAPLQEPSP